MTSPRISKQQAMNAVKHSINEKKRKYFSKVTDKTKKMDAETFPEFISKLVTISINEAKAMIESFGVTVDGELVSDITYQLKSGDVVRADVGHFLNNSGFMAVVK